MLLCVSVQIAAVLPAQCPAQVPRLPSRQTRLPVSASVRKRLLRRRAVRRSSRPPRFPASLLFRPPPIFLKALLLTLALSMTPNLRAQTDPVTSPWIAQHLLTHCFQTAWNVNRPRRPRVPLKLKQTPVLPALLPAWTWSPSVTCPDLCQCLCQALCLCSWSCERAVQRLAPVRRLL